MPFTKRATETIGLIRRAQREPEDADEITAQTGARYHIDRNPEPGVSFRLTELDGEGKPTAHCVAQVADTETSSSLYPRTLPHLPDYDTFVNRNEETHTVVWTRPAACKIPNVSPEQMDFLQSPVMQQLTAKMKPLAERAGTGDSEAKAGIQAALRDLLDHHPEAIAQLKEMWADVFNEPASVAEHEDRLRELTRQSTEAGWQLLEETRQEEPFREVLVLLEQDSRIRRLGLVHLGALQMLVLEEHEVR